MKNIKFIILIAIFILHPFYIKAEDDKFSLHFKKGNAYFKQSSYGQAINEYKKALSANSDHAKAHFLLALAYYHNYLELSDKRLEESIRDMFANPKENKTTEQDNLPNRDEKATYEMYIENLKKAIALDDRMVGSHYYLGVHYYNKKMFREAEKEFIKEIQLNPGYSNSYSMLGSIYSEKSEYKKAIEFYKKSLSIEPNFDGDHYELALIYNRIGMRKEALQKYHFLKSRKSILVESLKKHLDIK